MSLFAKYANMKCELRRTTTEKDKRLGVYNTDKVEEIDCYIYGNITLLRDAQGEIKLSDQTVLTTIEVKVGDFINGHEVKKVQAQPNIRGVIDHYEVTL